MEMGIKAGDLMTRNFVYVAPNVTVKHCAKMMVKNHVGSLIVKEGEKLMGILTEKDMVLAIFKISSKKNMGSVFAKDIMKKRVITISPSVDIVDALKKFKKKKIRRLPVVENGKLIGMLTTNDILKIDPGLFQMIAETIKIKEETKKLERSINGRITQGSGICEECGAFGILNKDESQWLCESCYNGR